MKSFLFSVIALAMIAMPLEPIKAASIAPGDLIKASGPAVYYYTEQGTRKVFPNEQTYFSWYNDFSGVITITDAELAAISLGGNIIHRPGLRMVKITTDPKVYAIGDNGLLRWITSEELAVELYGSDWANNVVDIPDAFFVDYEIGTAITDSADFSPSAMKDTYQSIAQIGGDSMTMVESEHDQSAIVGTTFSIALDANATTGYAWVADYDANYLTLTDESYVMDENDGGLVGVGGTKTFVFTSVAEGNTDIVLSYQRSASDVAEIRTYHVSITTPEPQELMISTSVTEAQRGQAFTVTMTQKNEATAESFALSANGEEIATCTNTKVCLANFTVPLSDAAESYAFEGVMVLDGVSYTASTTVPVISEQVLNSIIFTIAKTVIRETETTDVTVRPGTEINAKEIRIYVDNISTKACDGSPSECVYKNYLSGGIGSVHEIYATIKTPTNEMYRTVTKTITVSDNDAPAITFEVGKSSMLASETTNVTATADDNDGIATVQILQNDTVIKSCNGAAPCSVDVGPYTDLAGSSVSYTVIATDLLGGEAIVEDAGVIMIQ